MYEQHLADMLNLTKQLQNKVASIDSKMENNQEYQLKELEELFEKRQVAIEQISKFTVKEEFCWTASDQNQILELKILEEKLQPIIKSLYKAFNDQLKRINQTKQTSKKYIGVYQNMDINGAFIDKRK